MSKGFIKKIGIVFIVIGTLYLALSLYLFIKRGGDVPLLWTIYLGVGLYLILRKRIIDQPKLAYLFMMLLMLGIVSALFIETDLELGMLLLSAFLLNWDLDDIKKGEKNELKN
ncbi:hypothetical protein [Streptococcus plurextorum]|uniref:hypothetical protein n=1 Tax=Streptococcus plurextorum TaxID=456876 RepID=UPI00040A8BF6|nr:hypothetical protein [Streptococcus plurextorum]